jgi:hypothetical protein
MTPPATATLTKNNTTAITINRPISARTTTTHSSHNNEHVAAGSNLPAARRSATYPQDHVDNRGYGFGSSVCSRRTPEGTGTCPRRGRPGRAVGLPWRDFPVVVDPCRMILFPQAGLGRKVRGRREVPADAEGSTHGKGHREAQNR